MFMRKNEKLPNRDIYFSETNRTNRRSITSADQVVLTLLMYSLHNRAGSLQGNIDWEEVSEIAHKHMILPLVLQGVALLPAAQRPQGQLLDLWKNFTIIAVLHNEQLIKVQEFTIALLKAAHIPCAILKGTSVGSLYPKPELRLLGDIDLLVQEEKCVDAVKLLEANGYHKHKSDHSFHIGFNKEGIYLELHYAITKFPNNAAGAYVKNKLHDTICRIKNSHIDTYQIPVLSDTDQALALLLHMERHMVNSGIGLRQLCDWCMFINSIGEDALHDDVLPAIEECKLLQFACALTRICTVYLGLDSEKYHWCERVSRKTADTLLSDILSSGNIVSGERERASSSIFVKGEECSEGRLSMIASSIKNLTSSARKHFPISNKYTILLPFFWVYIPLRYWLRSMKGTRPKQSIGKIAKYAWKRKRLYRSLALFKK